MYATETSDPSPEATTAVDFQCDRRKLVGILVVNLILTILTLGIYRFWARTRVRRFLWSTISIDGDMLEYTGRGRELFIGFLIALVALTPLFIALNLVTNLLIPADPVLGGIVYTALLIVLAVLFIAGFYFARRYLLTRTRWRGVSAGQDGSVVGFVWIHAWTGVVNALSLWVATPWRDAKLYHYTMGITRFGTARFDADATPEELWRPWLVVLALTLGTYGVMLAGFWPLFAHGMAVEEARQAGQAMPVPPEAPGLGFWALLVAVMFGGSIAWYNYLIVRFRTFVGRTRLGEIRFRCDLPLRSVLGVVVGFVFLWFVALALAAGLGYLAGASLPPQIGIPTGFAVGFLTLLALNSLLTIGWFYVEMLRRVCRHLEIVNAGAADLILNRADTGPRRGEGLADALGDVGFV